jgi:Starch-binding associating with outer membrane
LRFTTLKNVVKMEEEAARIGLPTVNAYSALGKFFRAYFYYDMTMKVGDLPLSQALQGVENIAPKYDTQKEIFIQILKWLEEANTDLAARIAAADNTLQGDIYFDGDLRKWQKAVNAFKLRVLVQLSKKEADTDLDLKNQFANILNNPSKYPLFSGLSDNLAFRYNGVSDKYPVNPDNFGFDALRNNMSATHITPLKQLKDPRLFAVATPGTYFTDTLGLSPTNFDAYLGAPFDEGLDAMTTGAQGGRYCLIGRSRYYSSYDAEPGVQIGYAEQCFNIAEGLNRRWATANAAEWYDRGVRASMNFFGISDEPAINDYLYQASVAYKGDNADGLSQILLQRYLDLFQKSGMESYFHWRRTNQPAFQFGGPGTGNSGVIPRRFQYPTGERDNNTANYLEALKRQFNSTTDDINSTLWVER